MTKNCARCGSTYKTYPSQSGRRRFCSINCYRLASRKHPVIEYDNDVFYYGSAHGYYESAKSGRKLHRVVYEREIAPIPAGFVVHHKDENTTNNSASNLEAIPWGEHSALHNSVGIGVGFVKCVRCSKVVSRPSREIRQGQDKYCSRRCANASRARTRSGCYK